MRSVPAAALVLAPVLGALAYSSAVRAQDFQSYDARDLRIQRFVGQVEIETGGVDRVEVAWEPGEGILGAPDFEVLGDRLEITQLQRRTNVDCRSRGGDVTIEVGREGRHPIADYGLLRVRAPADAKVEIGGGAPVGSIGNVGELSVGLSSCGDLKAGDVAGDADLAVNGSGMIEVGAVGGGLSVAVNGSGDVIVASVAGGIEAAINGSGDVQVGSADGGDIEAAINGSGGVHVQGGQVRNVEAAIMGSGELRFDGTAEEVELSAFGSGDVYVAEVSGEVSTSAFGSGRVHVGRRD